MNDLQNKPFLKKYLIFFLILISIPFLFNAYSQAAPEKIIKQEITLKQFQTIIEEPRAEGMQALKIIADNWHDGYAVMLTEIFTITRDRRLASTIVDILGDKTKQSYQYDSQQWFQWVWENEPELPSFYPEFKSLLYGKIDPRFSRYFNSKRISKIKLEEVRWGGVVQDGIPPLRKPKMLKANEADYLEDSNIVFGIEVNGDARAYPKRILAWHEMFVDTVGDVSLTGVYCTLCGSMILYENNLQDKHFQLGTSGFLYRSNKLMYDQSTQSLWNTLWGRPVIGPLVDQGISLKRGSVVTTTWKEWKTRHPETQVLSLDTGHSRNYGEGVAYKDYFSTDRLMFEVALKDTRLKNKAEVLGLTFIEETGKAQAISADFLSKKPIYQSNLGTIEYVILTDRSGANRVYQTNGQIFKKWNKNQLLIDESGTSWKASESKLISNSGEELLRLPAHRAFWFGWYGAYPHTELVK